MIQKNNPFFLRKTLIKGLGILFATLFSFSLGSCVSESLLDVHPPVDSDSEVRTVSLRLEQSAPITRSESRPIGHNEAAFFRAGDLYFVTAAGTIHRHFRIIDAPTQSEPDFESTPMTIPMHLLETGVELTSLPGIVRYVVMVGNSQETLPTVGTMGHIESRWVHNHIPGQYNAISGNGVNLFGRSGFTRRLHPVTGDPLYSNTYPHNALYEAHLELAPTVARFEIHQISGEGQVVDFTVEGIFIDRHYRRAHINGFIPQNVGGQPNLMERGTTNSADTFRADAPCGYYPAGNNALFDLPGVRGMSQRAPDYTTGYSLTVQPNTPNVWSYQVFAQTDPHTTRDISPPRIVVRLTGVKLYYNGEIITIDEPQYLTVHGFLDTRTTIPTRLESIRAGNVYRILNLRFDERHLHYRPSRPINVEICVELAEWNGRPINPAGFRQPNPVGGFARETSPVWDFPLDEAVHGGCSELVEYLWQWSHVGGIIYTDWTPTINLSAGREERAAAIRAARAANPTLSHQMLDVETLNQTTFFRRIALACDDVIVTTQARVATGTIFEVSPRLLVFASTGGSKQVDVFTNLAAGWRITNVPGRPPRPNWISVPQAGTADGFDVTINQTALPTYSRQGWIRVVSADGSYYEDVRVIQVGIHASAIDNAFVGAFWRHNQMGERLIRMNQPVNSGWTAEASEDWIKLDWGYSPTQLTADPGTTWGAGESPASMTEHDAQFRLPTDAGSFIYGTGNAVHFRIGLRSTLLGPDSQPRYGLVIVTFNNDASIHLIWVRQGERADYLMRPQDLSSDNAPRGTRARRFTPFNLTAYELNAQVGTRTQQLDPNWQGNRSRFTQYPTQTGAFFKWAAGGAGRQRRAWAPLGTFAATYWRNSNPSTSFWNGIQAVQESCPPGFRRPNDGSTTANSANNTAALARGSEIRQSLFITPPIGAFPLANQGNNSVTGFYADGWFDRRQIVASPSPANVPRSTVAVTDRYGIAHRGTLVFNPVSGEFQSIFFPASGTRNDPNANNANTDGRLRHTGDWGYYWSSTRRVGNAAWRLHLGFGTPWLPTENRYSAFTIRCVEDPAALSLGGGGLSLSPHPFR